MLVSTPAEKGLIRRSFDHREAEVQLPLRAHFSNTLLSLDNPGPQPAAPTTFAANSLNSPTCPTCSCDRLIFDTSVEAGQDKFSFQRVW
jgi:hypothetical protein